MPFNTELTEMLGIEHPVMMGGLTGVGTPELAAAVSNAGGCGFVCAHQSGDPERCVEWLKQMDELTDKPWGVNLSRTAARCSETFSHSHSHTPCTDTSARSAGSLSEL